MDALSRKSKERASLSSARREFQGVPRDECEFPRVLRIKPAPVRSRNYFLSTSFSRTCPIIVVLFHLRWKNHQFRSIERKKRMWVKTVQDSPRSIPKSVLSKHFISHVVQISHFQRYFFELFCKYSKKTSKNEKKEKEGSCFSSSYSS